MRRTRTPTPASHSTAGQTSCYVSVELGHTGVCGWSRFHFMTWAYRVASDLYIFTFLPVAFRLYDLDRDDKISRDELLQVSGCVCDVNRNAESQYSLLKQSQWIRWWINIFQRHFFFFSWQYLPFVPCLTKEQMLLCNIYFKELCRKRERERGISMSMRRLCPCADNDVISHLNYRLIFPRQPNILYFGFLCAPSVLFVVSLWSHLGFGDIVWPVIALSSGLNDSDKSLVLRKTFLCRLLRVMHQPVRL